MHSIPDPRKTRLSARLRSEDGASLVEFALIAPLLFLLIFGIIDFGWLFAQHQDVRHGAREAARLAAVNYNPDGETDPAAQLADLITAVRARTGSLNDADTDVRVHRVDSDSDGAFEIGELVDVRVCYPLESLSGFMQPFLTGSDLKSSASMRLEQVPRFADNWNGSDPCP